MTFRTACLGTSIIWGALCLTLLLWPALVFWLFQIETSPSTVFMTRRAAMLFLGLATLMFVVKDTADVIAQRAVSAAAIAGMGGLAILGLFEFMRGDAGIGIWIAILVEVGLVGTFIRCFAVRT